MSAAAISSLILAAAAGTPAAKLRADAAEQARARVQDLFRALCPEQCVLVSVSARVDEEELRGAVPGFDAPGEASAPVLRSLSAQVALDAKLPAAFRGRVKDLVAARLGELGAAATVTADLLPFPVRNPTHLEAPPQPIPQPAAPPAAAPVATPPPAPESPALATAAPVSLDRRALERLIEWSPLLAVVALLGGVLLALGALIAFAVRRPAELPFEAAPIAPEQAQSAPAAIATFPASRVRRLQKDLAENRPLRNAVLREALERGVARLVAQWARELGEPLLDDLRGDALVADALAQVAREIARPAEPDKAAAALQELEGRLLAARLAHAGDRAEDAFAFLHGEQPEAFAAACATLPVEALDAALRFAPARLRAAALADLPAARQREVALAWARSPDLPLREAQAAAALLRDKLAALAGGAPSATRALAELIDVLPRAEQDALIDRLRRDGDARVVGKLFGESALLDAAPEAIAAAAVSLPTEKLVAYLAGAEPALRDRVLAAAPERLAAEAREELSLRGPSDRASFTAARRELIGSLQRHLQRHGEVAADRAARPRLVAGE